MKNLLMLFIMFFVNVSRAATPVQSVHAIESTIESKTIMCGAEFSDNEPIFQSLPIYFFKSALRLYFIKNRTMLELYVDAGKTLKKDGKLVNETVKVNNAWFRTQSGATFVADKDLREGGQKAFQKIEFKPEIVKLIDELITGQSVSIGFNLTSGDYDKVFEFKNGLPVEDRQRLKDCMTRLLIGAP